MTVRGPICAQPSRCPRATGRRCPTAREKLRTRLTAIKSLSPREVEAFYTAAEILVEPSVAYDSVATDTARQSAIESTQPRPSRLKRGQKIVDEGDVVTPDVLAKITAVQNYTSSSRQIGAVYRYFLIITALYLDRVEIRPASRHPAETRAVAAQDLCTARLRRRRPDRDRRRVLSPRGIHGIAECAGADERSYAVVVRHPVCDRQPVDDAARRPANGACSPGC